LAPVLFSTTTVVLSISPSGTVIRRAITSDVPPGGKGTMMVRGLSGHAAARAPSEGTATNAAADWMIRRRVFIVGSLEGSGLN
jgi:hypothetical protein